jgi:hypothetical protein
MKKLILFAALTWVYSHTSAQQLSPQVVTSVGASMAQGDVKLNFTIGEIVVDTDPESEIKLGQGVMGASATVSVTSITEAAKEILDMKLYPNPTSGLLCADITQSSHAFVQLTVTDIQGRKISSDTYATGANHIGINTQNWSAGTYLISVSDMNHNILNSYKIIKQ